MLTQFKSELGLKSQNLIQSNTINFGFLNSKKHSVLTKPVSSISITGIHLPHIFVWFRLKNSTMHYRKPVIPSIKMIKGQL